MADMMDTLKGLLGDDAEDKIKSVLGALGQSDEKPQEKPQEKPPENTIDMESMMKMMKLMESLNNTDDERSRLLMSLKPFMRSSRQQSIDNTIKLLGLSKISGLF